ncbi:hypothetical protein, partial [Roseibium sp. RKSG952]|uniref:hypothetical protein n=1 Tax=Roseibium sp. RKSG952 TaxID=2529384 RepID=UPI001AD925AA
YRSLVTLCRKWGAGSKPTRKRHSQGSGVIAVWSRCVGNGGFGAEVGQKTVLGGSGVIAVWSRL